MLTFLLILEACIQHLCTNIDTGSIGISRGPVRVAKHHYFVAKKIWAGFSPIPTVSYISYFGRWHFSFAQLMPGNWLLLRMLGVYEKSSVWDLVWNGLNGRTRVSDSSHLVLYMSHGFKGGWLHFWIKILKMFRCAKTYQFVTIWSSWTSEWADLFAFAPLMRWLNYGKTM